LSRENNKPIKAIFATLNGVSLTESDKRFLDYANPMGITLFGRNVSNKKQLESLLKEVREVLERDDVLVSIDQEGGRVRRMTEPGWRAYAPQRVLGQIGKNSERLHAQLIASDLKEVGINMNYAPVLDVLYENTTSALRSRCFSENPMMVASLGKTMVDEYIKNGVCPCVKHMPGHGRASVDPHLELPTLNYSLSELKKSDFYPFKMLNYAPAGMTAHVVIPEVDDKLPVTQSANGISKIIRGEIGFDGLLIADALDMKALKGSFGEKARASFEAGVDAVCYYTLAEKDIYDICDNAEILSDKSYFRFEKIKNIIKNSCNIKGLDQIALDYASMVKDGLENYQEEYDATMVLTQMQDKS